MSSVGKVSGLRERSQTRSGKRYSIREAVEDEADLARGRLRSGQTFRRENRGHYTSMAQLRAAHKRLFTTNSSLGIVELPVSTSEKGLFQAVLRLSTTDADPRGTLRRAFKALVKLHPDASFTTAITANVVLRSTVKNTFALYFGQRFGNARSIFLGQTHDDQTGHVTQLLREYQVADFTDLSELPVEFTAEDFGSIFRRNFDKSDVVVHSVVSLIYIFALGLDNYSRENTFGNRLHMLW